MTATERKCAQIGVSFVVEPVRRGMSMIAPHLRKLHIETMAVEPEMEISEELAALFERADLATRTARRLIGENQIWRQAILRQFDYMAELSAEFVRPGGIKRP